MSSPWRARARRSRSRPLRAAGVAGPGEDRHVAPELAAAERLGLSGGLLRAVTDAIGPLSAA